MGAELVVDETNVSDMSFWSNVIFIPPQYLKQYMVDESHSRRRFVDVLVGCEGVAEFSECSVCVVGQPFGRHVGPKIAGFLCIRVIEVHWFIFAGTNRVSYCLGE